MYCRLNLLASFVLVKDSSLETRNCLCFAPLVSILFGSDVVIFQLIYLLSLKLMYFTKLKFERTAGGHWSRPCIRGKRITTKMSVKTCSSWTLPFSPFNNLELLYWMLKGSAMINNKTCCFHSLGESRVSFWKPEPHPPPLSESSLNCWHTFYYVCTWTEETTNCSQYASALSSTEVFSGIITELSESLT